MKHLSLTIECSNTAFPTSALSSIKEIWYSPNPTLHPKKGKGHTGGGGKSSVCQPFQHTFTSKAQHLNWNPSHSRCFSLLQLLHFHLYYPILINFIHSCISQLCYSSIIKIQQLFRIFSLSALNSFPSVKIFLSTSFILMFICSLVFHSPFILLQNIVLFSLKFSFKS